MSHALAGEERSAALAKIPGWADVDGRDAIRKVYKFKGTRHRTTKLQISHYLDLIV
jgi:pterin-4a-carbinolamine dehydratase